MESRMDIDVESTGIGRGATRGGSGLVALRAPRAPRVRGRRAQQPPFYNQRAPFEQQEPQWSDSKLLSRGSSALSRTSTPVLPSDFRRSTRPQFAPSRDRVYRSGSNHHFAPTKSQSDTEAAFRAILAEPRTSYDRSPEPTFTSYAGAQRGIQGGRRATHSLNRYSKDLPDSASTTRNEKTTWSSDLRNHSQSRRSQIHSASDSQGAIASQWISRDSGKLLHVPTGPKANRPFRSRGGWGIQVCESTSELSDAPQFEPSRSAASQSWANPSASSTNLALSAPLQTRANLSGLSQRSPRETHDRRPTHSNEMTQTPMIDTFLGDLDRFARAQDGASLAHYFVLEPNGQGEFPGSYPSIIEFVRTRFADEDQLETYCADRLSIGRAEIDGTQWYDFIRFTTTYLKYLTLINPNDLLKTYNLLSDLVKRCNAALRHASLGIIILPTVVKCSRTLSTFAIHLDRNPKLTENVKRGGGEEGGGESLPELAANIIRTAFTTCFQDRSGPPSGIDGEGRPHGKKAGIYLLANLCLRILFQCRKLEAANIVFDQIVLYSPPLDVYPKAQQVTYLYYLGRFHFVTSHFHSAQAALSHAYSLCPKNPLAVEYEALKQRRLILIYLTASNIILGRFPSAQLYSQQDAQGLRTHFEPLCQAISKGDLTTFRRFTSFDSPHAPWFLRFRILLQLRNRCEVLVWRSLIRKIFILVGNQGNPAERKAPTLNLADIVQIMQLMEKRALMPITVNDIGPGKRNTNWVHMDGSAPARQGRYVDPDFLDASGGSVLDEQNGLDAQNPVDVFLLPTMLEVEAVVASLIDQGLIGGFISHKQKRLAIQGARVKGALEAGFPEVWKVMKAKGDSNVPGWKRRVPAAGGRGGFGGGSLGPGSVVRLSGARPVGMGP